MINFYIWKVNRIISSLWRGWHCYELRHKNLVLFLVFLYKSICYHDFFLFMKAKENGIIAIIHSSRYFLLKKNLRYVYIYLYFYWKFWQSKDMPWIPNLKSLFAATDNKIILWWWWWMVENIKMVSLVLWLYHLAARISTYSFIALVDMWKLSDQQFLPHRVFNWSVIPIHLCIISIVH